MRFEEEYLMRLCQTEDAPLLAPLVREMAEQEGAPTPDLERLTDMIAALLASGFSDFVLVEIAGQPMGCVQINYRLSTWATARYAALEDFYLRPAARNRGIGSSVLDYACQRAAGLECAFVELDVGEENHRARALYERMGFAHKRVHILRSPLPRRGRCHGTGCGESTTPSHEQENL